MRSIMLIIGVVAVGVILLIGFRGLPPFGGSVHPYRDIAVSDGLAHRTANIVSAINFDLRGFDTFGEESILLAAVCGVAGLLRPVTDEKRQEEPEGGRLLDSTRILVAVLFPVTILIGIDVVAHGAITPGGGFQGGVILATGMHLLYVGGRFRLLEQFRPLDVFHGAEALGLAAYGVLGLVGAATAGAFLTDFLPNGHLAELVSAGTVPFLSAAVGVAVTSSIVVLLASFLEQALVIREKNPDERRADDEGEAAA